MKRSDFIKVIAKKTRLSQRLTEEVVSTIFDEIKNQLKRDEKIVVWGFGTFFTKTVDKKKGIHPITKQEIIHKPHRVVRFIPSRKFRKEIK
ncbi:MAG: hypothetical protein GXP43_00135 [bacterium]|nr:hypothetical protein [bacterium]